MYFKVGRIFYKVSGTYNILKINHTVEDFDNVNEDLMTWIEDICKSIIDNWGTKDLTVTIQYFYAWLLAIT